MFIALLLLQVSKQCLVRQQKSQITYRYHFGYLTDLEYSTATQCTVAMTHFSPRLI